MTEVKALVTPHTLWSSDHRSLMRSYSLQCHTVHVQLQSHSPISTITDKLAILEGYVFVCYFDLCPRPNKRGIKR